ncbi:MAG: XdhC/CoxI family protein [Candidatus Omnitrophota bacterium]
MKKGQNCAIATIISSTDKGTPRKSGAKMIVWEDGSIEGTIGGGREEKSAQEECLKAIKNSKASLVTYNYSGKSHQSACGGKVQVFIEPLLSKKHLIICGAGHIALPLSILAKILNFKVTIIDNRKGWANHKRFPHVDQILVNQPASQLADIPISQNTFIMIVTHGHEFDLECLKTVAQSAARYIGVIASLVKRINFLKELKRTNVPEKFLRRIHMPAGIDIGAQTPEEISISIMAEIVSLTNKDFLGSDKFKVKEEKERRK